MSRRRSPDFLARLLDAALDVFGDRGLKNARMADIADRMGVAHGTLYNYVESKDAVFWLLIDRGLDPGAGELASNRPVKAAPMKRVLARLAQQIERSFAVPELNAALTRKRVGNAADELRRIVEELYDRTSETRRFAAALERSARDIPELYQLFFERVRRPLFDRVQRYLDNRMQRGRLRATVSAEVATRFVVESITFFARHRYADPYPMQARDSEVRAHVVALLVHALVPENT